MTEFVATHPETGRDAFASPVPTQNGTATVRFRASATGDWRPTYEFRFPGGTTNVTAHRWDDATLVREFSFVPDAFADGPIERDVAVFVREEGWRFTGAADEATRTVTFRRADGAGAESDDAEATGDGDATGGDPAPSTPLRGPVVGLRP